MAPTDPDARRRPRPGKGGLRLGQGRRQGRRQPIVVPPGGRSTGFLL